METRALQLADLPRYMRLAGQGVLLDGALMATQDHDAPQESPLAPLMPARSHHTFLTRGDGQTALGQFRHEHHSPQAHLTYLAPRALFENGAGESACLALLDALAAAAGRRGAHMLNGEVDELSPLFEMMRRAGFAVYARQELWRCPPGVARGAALSWQRARPERRHEMRRLLRALVPPMVHQALEQPAERAGWLYEEGGQVLGILVIRRGRRAHALLPYLHPRLGEQAAALLRGALALTPARLPRYITLRRYQDWWGGALPKLAFACNSRQAVLVRHIAAGVRVARFPDELREALEKGISPALEARARRSA